MKKKIKALLRDRLILYLVQFFGIVMIFYISVLLIKWNMLPPQLPLYYSLPRSADQLGTPLLLLLLPILSVVFFVIHLGLSAYFYPKELLASRILMITSSVVALIFFIAFIKIILLIT